MQDRWRLLLIRAILESSQIKPGGHLTIRVNKPMILMASVGFVIIATSSAAKRVELPVGAITTLVGRSNAYRFIVSKTMIGFFPVGQLESGLKRIRMAAISILLIILPH